MGNIIFNLKKRDIQYNKEFVTLPINFGIFRDSLIARKLHKLFETLTAMESYPDLLSTNIFFDAKKSEALFPALYEKSEKERSRILADEMILVWPNYRIDIKKFKDFFKHYATLNGGFSDELITKLCDQEPRPFNPNDPSWKNYRFQIVALRMWWYDQLTEQI